MSFYFNKFFKFFNLNGKALIPFILGFGCNVTSIYSTRIISNPKQRESVALISPFISCSARLIVFSLFAITFFHFSAIFIVLSLYMISIFVTIILAFVFKIFSYYKLKTSEIDNIQDISPYRLPKFKTIFRVANYSTKTYIIRAITIILFFSILIWFLSYYPGKSGIHSSFLYYLKYPLQYLMYPLGFAGCWILLVAIIPGIIAKEITVAALALLYGSTISQSHVSLLSNLQNTISASFIQLLPNHWFNSDVINVSSNNNWLQIKLKSDLTKNTQYPLLAAYSYCSFILLTIPCITTLSAIKHEFGNYVMIKSILLGFFVPYFVAMIVYNVPALILRL